jgi:ADP-ribose pyrophosphatase YjhB (NUDIX family)
VLHAHVPGARAREALTTLSGVTADDQDAPDPAAPEAPVDPAPPASASATPAPLPAADPAFAAYIAGLPRVLAGAAVLFRDVEGRVLLVEPNYREGWGLPGGTVESESGESPREGARRETVEEIGLDVAPGRLLAVDWVRGPGRPPLVAYLYDGGVLTPEQLAGIRLQEEELLSWRLVTPDEVPAHLSATAGRRVLAALEALETGEGPVELEDGHRAY